MRGTGTIALCAWLAGCGGGASPDAFSGSGPDGAGVVVDAAPPSIDAGAATYEDPEDLTTTDGDPSVDVRSVAISEEPLTFTVEMFGPWPPATEWYSWYFLLELYAPGSAAPTVSVTVQRHAGTPGTFIEGVAADSVVIEETAAGPIVRFTQRPTFDRFRVEAGIQKTNPGNRVVDVVETAAGDPIPYP